MLAAREWARVRKQNASSVQFGFFSRIARANPT
jgi:hypothetical protein